MKSWVNAATWVPDQMFTRDLWHFLFSLVTLHTIFWIALAQKCYICPELGTYLGYFMITCSTKYREDHELFCPFLFQKKKRREKIWKINLCSVPYHLTIRVSQSDNIRVGVRAEAATSSYYFITTPLTVDNGVIIYYLWSYYWQYQDSSDTYLSEYSVFFRNQG